MDVFDKDIGRDEQGLCPRLPHLNDSDIITDPLDQCRVRRGYPFSDSMDEPKLTDLLKIVFRVRACTPECSVSARRRDP